MSNLSEQMRLFMALTEAEYKGPLDHPEVNYSHEEKKGEITKVIANLKGYQSGRFTKLGRTLNRISWLSDKLDQLKQQAKQETREHIAELFNAEDAARTRVIDTVGFIFTMTKDPKPSETVKYAKVLEELEEHLTPELLMVLEGIKSKYTTIVEKEPALIKAQDKSRTATESVELNEGVWDSVKAFVHKYAQKVMSWAKSYDAKLDALKAQVNVHESIVDEGVTGDAHALELIELFQSDAINVGKAYGSEVSREQIATWTQKMGARKQALIDYINSKGSA